MSTVQPRRSILSRHVLVGWLCGRGGLAVLLATLLGGCKDEVVDFREPDLLGYWPLDESQAGGSVADASGFGFNGTPSESLPTPSTNVAPVRFANSHSLSFNGKDQLVSMGNPAGLNLGGPITLAAWVRANNSDGYHTIVTHGYRTNPNFDVGLRITSGEYEFAYWDGPNHAARSNIPSSDIGVWVHLCGTFDGASYNLYRDGVLTKSTADSASPPANMDAPWAIGGRVGNPQERPMDGEIDEVRIYGRALSAAEVQALYRR
jgi:hypothetical protein